MWIKQRTEKNKGMRSGNTGWRSRNETQRRTASRSRNMESQWVNRTHEAQQRDEGRFWGEEVVMRSRRAVQSNTDRISAVYVSELHH